ncbi:hypothetical protein TrST_g8026 [Triparma strigata]|uniref:Uncharacterized protein n=1 Tax=Triparma strigata TaxID=1606541 RepID=A0A9W7B6Q8_9STRA|nr:hypothetical protein TrST_g8026 [Triparma strigata]
MSCPPNPFFLLLLVVTLSNSYTPKYMVIWKGEGDKSYVPLELRHQELTSALSLLTPDTPKTNISFTDVLPATDLLQYVNFPSSSCPTPAQFSSAMGRCATPRSGYFLLGSGDSFSSAAGDASSSLPSPFTSRELETASWSLRARDYRGRKFGNHLRSPLRSGVERASIIEAADFTTALRGPVKLNDPELALFSFILPPNNATETSNSSYLLLRQFCFGFDGLRKYDPNTRICVTSTPLEPIAAFSMANVGMVTNQSAVLDPYCGSATSLLASAALAPACRTVGIERDGPWLVNFTEVKSDFTSRNLPPPQLIRGDCRESSVRQLARSESAPSGFDVILADPPYGKRERKDTESEPLFDIMSMIIADKLAGTPLLKPSGRLVVFVPVPTSETLESGLTGPEILEKLAVTSEIMNQADLKLVEPISAQRLNKSISRLLLVFTSNTKK